jgi:hypothetical protein
MTEQDRCWDCPGRTGLSAITGKVAVRFWGHSGNLIGLNRIERQRSGCPGRVAALLHHSITGRMHEEDGSFTTEKEAHDLYEAVCPRDYPELITAHEEVTVIMRQNELEYFTHHYVEPGSTLSAEEMQEQRARMHSKLEALRANRAV